MPWKPNRPPPQPPTANAPATAGTAAATTAARAADRGSGAARGSHPRERRTPGNVEHQLDEIAPGNSPDEPVLVPPRQCPHTPAHPFRTATPPGTSGLWERRAHGPRSDSMKEPSGNSPDEPVLDEMVSSLSLTASRCARK